MTAAETAPSRPLWARLRRSLSWWMMALVVLSALAVASRRPHRHTLAAREHALASVMRCPTCRGQSVADSDAPASQDIRKELDRRVKAGQSDGQIRAYFRSRYGPFIFLSPERSGLSLLVWLLPLAALGGAVAGTAFYLHRHVRNRLRSATPDDEALVATALGHRRSDQAAPFITEVVSLPDRSPPSASAPAPEPPAAVPVAEP